MLNAGHIFIHKFKKFLPPFQDLQKYFLKYWRILVLVIAGFILITIVLQYLVKPKSISEDHRVLVQVMKSHGVSLIPKLTVSAVTVSKKNIALRAETSGRVIEVCGRGQFVKKGDILIKLADKDRLARYKEAKAKLEQRIAEYNASIRLKAKAFKSKNSLLAAKSDLETAKAQLKSVEVEMNHSSITAPIDGYFQEQHVDEGDFINVGGQVGEMIQIDPLLVRAELSEKEVAGINQKASVSVIDSHQKFYQGKITYVSKKAEPRTRTLRVEVEINNHDHVLNAGSVVSLKFHQFAQKVHKILPSHLVLSDKGIVGVMVVGADQKTYFKPVRLIQTTEDVLFVSGLDDDVMLITRGAGFIKAGQEVKTSTHP